MTDILNWDERIEMGLGELTRRAMDTDESDVRRELIIQLFSAVTIHADDLAIAERTTDPIVITRQQFHYATERMGIENDRPKDRRFDQDLKLRRRKLPIVNAVLDEIITEN